MNTRLSLLVLIAASTIPASAAAIVQQTESGSSSAEKRCVSNCSSREERLKREKLVLRIDSLKWEIENRRLSESQRQQVSQEIREAILALQGSLGGAHAQRMTPAAVAVETHIVSQSGYLGVTFDGPSMDGIRDGERVIRFYQYPRIALVEHGSPAERAGILAGDTLLAFNGADVSENEFSLTRLLVPQGKLSMRLRREGNTRDVKVVVGEMPDYYVRRSVPVAPRVGAVEPRAGPVRVYAVPEAPAGVAQPAPVDAQGYAFFYSRDGFAGARAETLSEGLARAVGVREGVLVIRANPGTPAYRSGLRDGDVILTVDGKRVTSVRTIQDAMAASRGGEGVKLYVRRDGRQQVVGLKW